jgi:hypothetical protein
MAVEMVWMRHGESGGVQAFPEDALEAWRALGWSECDPPAEPDPALVEHVPVPTPKIVEPEPGDEPGSSVAAQAAEPEE